MGRYYSITGPRIDRYLLVESITEIPPLSAAQVDELIAAVEVA
jgi:replication factor A1